MIALRLLSLLGWLKTALTALADLARRYPLAALCIALVCLSAWLWRADSRHVAERDLAREEIASLIAASKVNAAALEKQRKEAQARYDTLAKETDHARKQMDAPAYAGLDRYIAGRRKVPSGPDQRTTPAVTEADSSGLREGVPAGNVMVDEADLRICTARTLDYIALREWALGL